MKTKTSKKRSRLFDVLIASVFLCLWLGGYILIMRYVTQECVDDCMKGTAMGSFTLNNSLSCDMACKSKGDVYIYSQCQSNTVMQTTSRTCSQNGFPVDCSVIDAVK